MVFSPTQHFILPAGCDKNKGGKDTNGYGQGGEAGYQRLPGRSTTYQDLPSAFRRRWRRGDDRHPRRSSWIALIWSEWLGTKIS